LFNHASVVSLLATGAKIQNFSVSPNKYSIIMMNSREILEFILKPAMEILRKYDFKLPIISNYQYNLRLKVVQEIARIKQSLHSHMARHSFAVMALNMGVSIENLAKMMGHTDIKTTQIYAKVLNKSVQEEFEKMDSKL